MRFQVALFQVEDDGAVRLLGKTDEPSLVEPVRVHLLEREIKTLRSLGFTETEGDGEDTR